ncbi:MAG: UvrD-helicase domain-containing protein, partial [Alphaproteobacteria bacterium]|nr:UvrD-helicase domain-containing protein [Alphaproteobacteria bacterium]
LWIGTFHSICVRILRKHAAYVNLNSDFTILDTDDQLRLIKQVLSVENLDDKKFPARAVLGTISRWKDRALKPDQIPAADISGVYAPLKRVYAQYQQRLATLNAVDFGDLLMLTVDLFTRQKDVLKHYQDQFKYILVDEYQDTNVAQYLWLRLLGENSRNICCVGDDDQSIYGWRGAEIANILRFEKDFPGAVTIRLEQNYRSTPHILGAASALIAHNKDRLGKTLWTESDAGSKISVCGVWDGQEEARVVGDEIEALQRNGTPLSQVAILVRAGFQTREFEDRFLTIAVPYKVIGGPRFYERLEIRDALAYLRVVTQPHNGLAFERIVNTPKRGIGTASLQSLHQLSRHGDISMYEAARQLVETDEVRGKARTSLKTLVMDIARWHQQTQVLKPAEIARIVLDESGYTTMWKEDKSPEAPGRLENLKEFVRALEEYETLQIFLEHVSLVMENNTDNQKETVSIMTLHSAKGLEFDTVFLAGWEEGLFPHPRSLKESGLSALEEERRLAYVGITRAKKQAIISFAANRRIHGVWQSSVPSRFLDELPEEHVDFMRQPGLHKSHNFSQNSTYAPGSYNRISNAVEHILPQKKTPFQKGERVFHQKFGYGIVKNMEAEKVYIDFERTGPRCVLASFLEKT